MHSNSPSKDLPTLTADGLKGRSIRGSVVTLGTQALSEVLTLLSVAVLARLLTPEDYGSVAMVTVLTGFLNLFRELGLSTATIQKQGLSHAEVSTLFYINAGLGALITLGTISAAPLVAWFYGKPHLAAVTVALSFCSLFSSLGTQHAALLNRQMRFRAMAAVQLTSLVAGFTAALVVALLGGAHWAIVTSNLTIALWSTVGFWVLSGFRPAWPRRGTDVADLLRFGSHVAGFNVVNYFRSNVDRILVGRAWGAQSLGLYDKAFSILQLPSATLKYPLNRVAFPALSTLANEPRMYRSYFAKYSSMVAFSTMPFVVFMYATSDSIVRLVLGDQWIGAAELFRLLAVAGFIETVAGLRVIVISSSGYGSRLFLWGLVNTAVTLCAVLAGLPWGVKGVATAYSACSVLAFHPMLVFAVRRTPVRPVDFYRAFVRPAVASIAMLACYRLLVHPSLGGSDIAVVCIAFPFCAGTYLGAFAALPGGRVELREYWRYVLFLLPLRGTPEPETPWR